MHLIFSQLCSFFVSHYHYKAPSPEVSRNPQITTKIMIKHQSRKKKLTKINMLVSASVEQALLLQDSWDLTFLYIWTLFPYIFPISSQLCPWLSALCLIVLGSHMALNWIFLKCSLYSAEGRGNISLSLPVAEMVNMSKASQYPRKNGTDSGSGRPSWAWLTEVCHSSSLSPQPQLVRPS